MKKVDLQAGSLNINEAYLMVQKTEKTSLSLKRGNTFEKDEKEKRDTSDSFKNIFHGELRKLGMDPEKIEKIR